MHFTSLVARQKVSYSLLTLSQPHTVPIAPHMTTDSSFRPSRVSSTGPVLMEMHGSGPRLGNSSTVVGNGHYKSHSWVHF